MSIHAIPQVLTAAFAFGEEAGSLTTLVKLVRVTLLAPFLIVPVLIYSRNKGDDVRFSKMIPSFRRGFPLLAVLTTMQPIPALLFDLASWAPNPVRTFEIPLAGVLVHGGNIPLTIVMSAMGMQASLRTMPTSGRPALLTGLAACLALAAFSLTVIKLWL